MSTIDDRVISLKFDNAQFEKNISATLANLDKLDTKISQVGAAKGFGALSGAANSVDLAPLAAGVDNISSKFNSMGAVGFSAIQNLTNGVINFGKTFISTDILQPLISGGRTRASNIAQAQFQFEGLGTNVKEVMQNSLDAVKGTAYGLGDAAKAAGQFAASGISAGSDMTSSLRAIAGTAAMTGTAYSDMAYLFTTSAASGRITNMDLQQFATRGLNAAAAYAKQTGKTEAQVHEMATKGTLDYKSFAAAMDAAYGKHATDANKTYAGSLDNMHAAMSRLGASYFGPEQLQQRDLFNSLTPVIDNVNASLQPLIGSFLKVRQSAEDGIIKTLGKIKISDLITGLAMPDLGSAMENAFKGFSQVLGTIKSAFSEIFPTNLTLTILTISEAIRSFSEHLILSKAAADKLKTIFEGLFSILSIGWAIFKGVVTTIKEIVAAIAPAGSGVLDFGVGIANVLIHLKEFLVDGGKINAFFVELGKILVIPIKFIDTIIGKLLTFFAAAGSAGANNVTKKFDSISSAAGHVASAWDVVMSKLQGVFHFLDGVWGYISNWFSTLGQNIAGALKQTNFNSAIDVINVGLLGGITVMLSKFLSGGIKFGFGGGLVTKVNSTLSGLTRSLKAMQTNLKASALLKIAAAVAILAVSIALLATIDSAGLTKALTAMAVGFGELFVMMTLMEKSAGTGGILKLSGLSAILIALSSAMLILAIAMKIMGTMSWSEIGRGLVGIAGGLAIMVTAVNLLNADPTALVRTGITMGIMAASLYILSKAVESFGKMSWSELGKGLVGVAGGLLLMVLAMNAMPPTGVLSGVGFVAIAVGLNILAKAVESFGHMSWGALLKGLAGVAMALLAVAVAMSLMPMDLPITAAGLLIVSVALNVMAVAINELGHLSWESLIKGIGGLGVMMLILVVAMNAMNGSIAGAGALVVVSGALVILAKVMETLGKLSISEIATSLGAIAAVLIILGAAAAILEPVIPAMLALGIALAVIGGAFALFGAGALMAVTALSLFASVGVKAITALVQAMPALAAAAALFAVNFAQHILDAMPVFIKVITAVLEQILVTIIKLAPLLGKAFVSLMTTMLDAIHKLAPKIINTGLFILVKLLEGISKNIKQLVTLGSDIIIKFLDALTLKMPQIVTSGVNVIVAFINGVTNNMGRIITAGTNLIIAFINGIASNSKRIIDAAFQAILTFINGLTDAVNTYAPQIRSATLRLGEAIINGVTGGLANKIGDIMSWCTGLAGKVIGWIGDAGSWLLSAGGDVIHGLWKGILDAKDWFVSKLGWFAGLLPGFVKDILGIHSPSTVFAEIGNNIMLGWAGGIEGGQPHVQKTLTNVANNMTKTFNSALSDSLSNMSEFNPVITPVLDLTRVQSQSSKIAGYLNVSSITPGASIQQANVISNTSGGSNNTSTPSTINSQPGDITFIQNNNSPKALSAADIYRNTKSQIALAKEELSIP